jgi:hypothetical protein
LHFIVGVLSASSGARRKSRMSLRLGEEVLLGEFRSAFVGCVRFVWPFPVCSRKGSSTLSWGFFWCYGCGVAIFVEEGGVELMLPLSSSE